MEQIVPGALVRLGVTFIVMLSLTLVALTVFIVFTDAEKFSLELSSDRLGLNYERMQEGEKDSAKPLSSP